MRLKSIRKYLKSPHAGIMSIILFLIFSAFLISAYIPQNTAVFIGEYIFSFDYPGHVQIILNDYKENESDIDDTNCHNCPDFYHYSRWYSLFKIGYLSIGTIIHLHPFIFLLLSMISLQLVGLYVFSRIFFKNFLYVPFLVASVFFILYPYKYHVLVETHDGTIFGSILLLFSIVVVIFRKIAELSYKKLLGLSLLAGGLFSLFLNINIAYFPFVVYLIIFVGLYFIKSLLKNIKKFCIFTLAFILPAILINFPVLRSLTIFGNTRHYENYISFNYMDSFLAGVSIAQVDLLLVYTIIFLLVLSTRLSTLTIQWRLKLASLYIFVGILLLGVNSPVNIFGWIFEHLPFMDAIRSTYRMFFFQLTIMFILIYHLLAWFNTKKGYLFRSFYATLICICLLVPIIHIKQNINYIQILQVPNEYFIAQKYLNSLAGEKIYFPNVIPGLNNLANSFSWSNPEYKETIVIYKNPFTSLLPIRDIVNYEKFPHLSPSLLEIRNLTDMNQPTKDIIKALSLLEVKYIIYDGNYNWQMKNQYQFSKKELLQSMELKKRIGNIYILEVPQSQEACIPSYGDFRIGNCLSIDAPLQFINRTAKEYLLETSMGKYGLPLNLNKDTHYYRNIIDPSVKRILLDNKVLFSHKMLQVEGNQKSVFFSEALEKGEYYIYIPLLQLNTIHKQFGDAFISLRVNDNRIREIPSTSQCSGVNWIKVPISINENNSSVAIDVLQDGYIILSGTPVVLDRRQQVTLSIEAKKINAIQNSNTYTMTINGVEKSYPNDCNSIEINLLDSQLQEDLAILFEKSSETFITKEGEKVLTYEITASENIHDIEVVSEVYYLSPEKTMRVQLWRDGTEIYQSNESTQDKYPNIFRIPNEKLNGTSYTLQIVLSSSGISLKNLYLRADIAQ